MERERNIAERLSFLFPPLTFYISIGILSKKVANKVIFQLDSYQLQEIINAIEKIQSTDEIQWKGYVVTGIISLAVALLSSLIIQLYIDFRNEKKERLDKNGMLSILVSEITNFSDNGGEQHKNLNNRLLKIQYELKHLCEYYYRQNINADPLLDIIIELETLINRLSKDHNGYLTDEEYGKINKVSEEITAFSTNIKNQKNGLKDFLSKY